MGKLQSCLNVEDFRRSAKARLPLPLFDYIEGGADDEYAIRNNVAAFDHYQWLPHYLKDVRNIDLERKILGRKLAWPLILSPTGMSRLFHAEGEKAVAAAAAQANIGYALSTMGSASIEEIGALNSGLKIFQLYLLKDEGLNRAMIARARAAGFDALCITVDCIIAGNRERDLRHGLTVPPRFDLATLSHFARRPAWCFDYLRKAPISLPNIGDGTQSSDIFTLQAYFASHMADHISWADVENVAKLWGGPLAIKGIQSVQDAHLACAHGATAVMISNHGGRQLDGVAAPVDLIAGVADAVRDQCEIIIDGGIRRGSHIAKALALGAHGCMMGRPYLYALAAHGGAGVERLLSIMEQELRRTLKLLGCARLQDLNRAYLQHI